MPGPKRKRAVTKAQASAGHRPETGVPLPTREPIDPSYKRFERDGIVILSNLPDNLPILPAEIKLLEMYFSDLIDDALKASS